MPTFPIFFGIVKNTTSDWKSLLAIIFLVQRLHVRNFSAFRSYYVSDLDERMFPHCRNGDRFASDARNASVFFFQSPPSGTIETRNQSFIGDSRQR